MDQRGLASTRQRDRRSLGCRHHRPSQRKKCGSAQNREGFSGLQLMDLQEIKMMFGRLIIWMVRGYQRLISRYTPSSCRFYPTCSQYGLQAISRHGLLRGVWLGSWRILRCNPWSAGGIDRVPQHFTLSCCGPTDEVEIQGGEGV